MTRPPAKAGLIPALGLGITLAFAAPAAAVVVPPEPPEIAFFEFACSDDVDPGTGSASITIRNPVDSNGETRTYAWTLTGPGGTDTGGVSIPDGALETVVSGLTAGDYDFETYDAVLPALSASTSFTIPVCPPPRTTSTSTTTTTATTTTSPGTTVPGTTVVEATVPPTPSPTIDPGGGPSLLPATGSNSVGFAVLAAAALFAGSLALLLSRRAPRETTG